MADDPDAMWRPGFTGEVVYPARVAAPDDGAARHRRPRRGARAVGVVVAIAVALAAGVVAVVVWPTPAEESHVLGLPALPDDPARRWTVRLPGPGGDVVVAGATDRVIVAANARERSLLALDPATGDRRWRAELPAGRVDQLAVIGGAVVVALTTADGTPAAVVGIDAIDGAQRWVRTLGRGAWPTLVDGEVAVFHRSARAGGRERIERWEPSSGEVVATVEADQVAVARTSVQARRGDRLALHDPVTLGLVAEVDLGALGLRDVADVTGVRTAAGPVVASPSAVMLVDGGVPTSTIALDGSPADSASVSLDVLDAEGRLVALQHGDELTVLEVADGRLTVLWDDDALLLDWHGDGDRTLVATTTVTGSVLSGRPQIVDAVTGDAIDGARAVVQFASPFRTFAGNGFIDVTRRPGTSQVVVGYDLERNERWRFAVAERSEVHLLDGGVLEVDRSHNPGTTVTLHA